MATERFVFLHVSAQISLIVSKYKDSLAITKRASALTWIPAEYTITTNNKPSTPTTIWRL